MLNHDIAQLRQQHYNATLVELRHCHCDLLIARVSPDEGVPHFQPGQYTVLGLGNWEQRVAGVQPEADEDLQTAALIKRAYSISCPMLSNDGRLTLASASEFLEFYIALVRQAEGRAPALTPRLFDLQPGSRLYCGPHVHGHYTLAGVNPDDNVVFASTGTGEAPHNAMLTQLLHNEHQGQIACVTCARWNCDFGYEEVHRRLEQRFANYHYLTLTTREPQNLDPSSAGFVGKRYLQEYFRSGDFEQHAGFELTPDRTHVFLCGSPEMIGVPRHTHDPQQRYPEPTGMVEVLERRGLHVDRPHEPGNIHFEKYW